VAARRNPRSQRGVAALFVTVMLCFLMVLAAGLAQRNVVVEEQRSANDLRASVAFQAADAGLEWALARVNDPAPTTDTCLPSADPSAPSFRARMLRIDVASGAVVPSTWDDAGVATPLRAACVRAADGWTCSCPASGPPVLPATDAGATAATFIVELTPSARPGVVGVVATGCTRATADGACAAPTAAGREATRRVEVVWALLPALRALPAAALTVGGDVVVGAAPLGVHNADAASGALALHAGGRIVASALRVGAPVGGSLGASLVDGDASLRALAAGRLFARHFGMDRPTWTAQPAARRVACGGDCTSAMASALASGARLLAIDGNAEIAGPLALGAPDDPVALAVDGALRLSRGVAIHGVVHAASLEWNDASAADGFVRGAVVVAGDLRGDAGVDFVRDGAVLERLARASGSFVRVNGSWKDF
jgi:hypothetical protein